MEQGNTLQIKTIQSAHVPTKERKSEISAFGLYHLLHSYLITVKKDTTKDHSLKLNQLQLMGQKLGRNIMIKISEDSFDQLKREVSKDPNPTKYTEHIKFICKDFWIYFFGKVANRIQTNSQGTFYLYENDLPFLQRISHQDSSEVSEYVQLWVKLLSGIVEGALVALCLEAEVTCKPTVETNYNEFTFTIDIKNDELSQASSNN